MMDFLSVGIGRFRKFGFPFQFRVNSRREIEDAIQKYNGIADCYLSISEHQEIDDRIVTFPLFYLMDFDVNNSNNISNVENEVAMSLNWLENNKLNYQLDFSGRGYHILIELSQRERVHNIHFRDFYRYLTTHLDLKTLDPMCSEIMRIKRIPETINLKSNKLCCTLLKHEGVPLNLFDYIENIEYKNDDSEYKCGDYKCSIGTSRFIFPFDTNFEMPCIFEELKQGETSHKSRWMWVKLMQFRGYSFKEIFDLAKKFRWNDFSPDITNYQIQYTMSRNYVLKCNLDICKKECFLRKNINRNKKRN